MMSNKLYDVLKFIAMILLPALTALYGSVGNIWGLPYVEQIVATLAALDTFMGAVLQISSSKYHEQNDEE